MGHSPSSFKTKEVACKLVKLCMYACAHLILLQLYFIFIFITIQHNIIHVGYTQLAQVARCKVHPVYRNI